MELKAEEVLIAKELYKCSTITLKTTETVSIATTSRGSAHTPKTSTITRNLCSPLFNSPVETHHINLLVVEKYAGMRTHIKNK